MSSDVTPPKEAPKQSTILRVYNYESGTKSTKQKRTLELPASNDPSSTNLGGIRSLLVERKVFESTEVKNAFCDTFGAEVSDEMTFAVYLDQLEDDKKEGDGKEEFETKVKDGSPANTSSPKILKVYYKKRKIMRAMNDVATEFLKKQLDLKLREAPELQDVRAELLASAFNAEKWKASTGGSRSIAANLTEKDWSVIIRTNCLLSGYKLIFTETLAPDKKSVVIVPMTTERTPFNAFKLKARVFGDYEVAAPPSQAAPETGPKTDIEATELSFHIPRFRVDDTSYVNVLETRTALQSSLAKSSFSNTSVEASVGGGFWGVSAAIKGGFSKDERNKEFKADAEAHDSVHISYNFPRVTVFLDANSVELTPEIKADIRKVRNKESLKAFSEKYGDVFPRRVKLGGKLTSTSKVHSKTESTENQRENALKIAAASSFSGVYRSISGESDISSGDKHRESTDKQGFESNLTWEATGGDTTLCNDPPKWCRTVGSFYNWRVVEYDDAIPLPRFISTFKDFEDIEAHFEKLGGFVDTVDVGTRMYTKIRLRESKTSKYLVASTNSNPLKNALEKISKCRSGASPAFGTPKEDLFKQIGIGGIFFPDNDEDVSRSTWTLEHWVVRGESPLHLYGIKTNIINTGMPTRGRYLGVTGSMLTTEGSGFLYPTSEKDKAWFILQSPPDRPVQKGTLKTGDVVEIRVRDKADSTELGIFRKCSYHGYLDPGSTRNDRREILGEMRKVPGFAQRKSEEESANKKGSRCDTVKFEYRDENFLQFEVEVISTSNSL